MQEQEIIELQGALNEASLILECCAYVTAAEHRDPGRWRDAVSILHGVIADRIKLASKIAARMELGT